MSYYRGELRFTKKEYGAMPPEVRRLLSPEVLRKAAKIRRKLEELEAEDLEGLANSQIHTSGYYLAVLKF